MGLSMRRLAYWLGAVIVSAAFVATMVGAIVGLLFTAEQDQQRANIVSAVLFLWLRDDAPADTAAVEACVRRSEDWKIENSSGQGKSRLELSCGLPLPVGQWSQRCWPWDRILQRCLTVEASSALIDALGGRRKVEQRFPTEACTAARSRSLEPYFEARFGRGPDGRLRSPVPIRFAFELFCTEQMRVRLLGR
jgi:hypothetical protein